MLEMKQAGAFNIAQDESSCVVFGMPGEGMEHDEILEMLELFGDVVIPEFDRDPVHSTTRYREAAQPRFPMFNHPVPDINVELLPTTALKPLG